MTSRHYCITFFTEPSIRTHEKVRYAIYGKEIAPTTGAVHWQAYVELYKPQRIAALKKIYNDKTLHAEIRRGTRDEARDYCKKDGDWTEHGKWIKGQGHRTDLETVVSEMQEGKKLSDIMTDQPALYCQYRNGLKDIAANITKKNTKKFRKVEVELLTGPTGCGKTRKAMETSEYRIQGTQLAWWQDYDGEDTICIDEYSNDVPITEMLNLLDGYQLRLNVKGTHTYANWNKVFITTNLKPDELHPNAKQAHRDALFRRITKITSFWDKPDPGENVTELPVSKNPKGNTRPWGPQPREDNLEDEDNYKHLFSDTDDDEEDYY